MIEKIPNIEFKQGKLPEIGFEIIELTSLYKRMSSGSISFATKPHRVNFHNLILYTENLGQHFVDFHTFPVEKGSVVFVHKGQVHAFDIINKPQGKLILFTETYLQKVFSAVDVQILQPTHFLSSYLPSFTVNKATQSTLQHLLNVINNEYLSSSPNIVFLQILFAALLTKVEEERPDIYHHQLSSFQIACFEHFIQLLHTGFLKRLDAQTYAQKIGTSYKTLNKICKLATNMTAKQLIDAYTILEAKRRLLIENMQVQQLAYFLGFEEPTNFVKYFKKHTLMTPSQFKKMR